MLVAVLLLEAACSSGQVSSVGPSPTPPATASASVEVPSPGATPSGPRFGWNRIHSDKWGYTLDYPAAWYDQGTLGAPDSERYFANRKSIGAPINMGTTGLFVSLSRIQGACPGAPIGTVDKTKQLTVGDRAVTRVSGRLGGAEAYWSAYAGVPDATVCYNFAFIFGSKATRDANLQIVDEMVSSFRTR